MDDPDAKDGGTGGQGGWGGRGGGGGALSPVGGSTSRSGWPLVPLMFESLQVMV